MGPLRSTTHDAQRNIYRWYDERYSDDAFNIYSEEWEIRFDSWHQTTTVTNIEEAQNDLEMGNFFLSDPIAAFSLWNLLQVCYDLDVAVCGSPANAAELAFWKTLPPFKYLGDASVKYQWKNSLKVLKNSIKHPNDETERLEGSWESRMQTILLVVERFEDSFAVLRENFAVNLTETAGKRKCAEWMMNRISEEMGMRFSLITNLLEIKDDEFVERDLDDQDELDYSQPNPPYLRPTYRSWPVYTDPESQHEEPVPYRPLVKRRDASPHEPQISFGKQARAGVGKYRQRFINFKNLFRRRHKTREMPSM